MAGDFSLIDLRGVSKPLTKLIESVSRGIGVLYEPTARVRNAKAKAKEMLLLAETNQQIEKLSGRAQDRIVHREIRRQNNIDSIIITASQNLPDSVSSEELDEDWITCFFDYCQDVGSSQMQQIWAKILAGEVATPRSFHPRTLFAVKSMTVDEAEAFTKLCEFSFLHSDGSYFLPSFDHDFYRFIRANGISTETELHLRNIGLLSSTPLWHQADLDTESSIKVSYFKQNYKILLEENDEDTDPDLQVFPFTSVGNELAAISGALPNAKYTNLLLNKRVILHI